MYKVNCTSDFNGLELYLFIYQNTFYYEKENFNY